MDRQLKLLLLACLLELAFLAYPFVAPALGLFNPVCTVLAFLCMIAGIALGLYASPMFQSRNQK